MSSQTKCPNCQTTYPMPAAKLGDPKARAKCGKCQQVFFLNANLVVSTPQPNPAKPQVISSQPSSTTTPVSRPARQPVAQQTPTSTVAAPQKPVQPKNTTSENEDLSLPSMPRRSKRIKPTPTEGMIHDEMEETEGNKPRGVAGVTFSDDELDNFLNENISFAPRMARSTKDEITDNEDETWINNLLDDSKPVRSSNRPVTAGAPIISDVDLDAIIPVAAPKAKKRAITRRMQPNKPTAQQVAAKKPIGTQLLWTLGCLLLIGLLVVQYALFNVDKLAKKPKTASLVHSVCGIARCHVPSADLSSLKVDSKLQGQKNIIINISNTSSSEQLFPYLLVQLKDKNGAVVADFVADTKDYLAESQTTLLANQQKRIMLTATNTSKATSVVVTPFYDKP